MQISTKFTIAIHILTAVEFYKGEMKVTSDLLAESIGCNPVIVRNIMGQLKKAGFVAIKRGPGGISFQKPTEEITLFDIYRAVEADGKNRMFRFHDNLNEKRPVGGNIHAGLDGILDQVQQDFEASLAKHTIAEVIENVQRAFSEKNKREE